jgi:hypothetical protein
VVHHLTVLEERCRPLDQRVSCCHAPTVRTPAGGRIGTPLPILRAGLEAARGIEPLYRALQALA